MTTEIIDEYLACASIEQISLSDYVTESITHGDLISTGEDITNGADKIALRQALDDVIALLTPRDQLLMRLRFGLEDDGKEHTLAEIAERTGVSRERVRQIINVSLQRIGQSESARVLRETTER
jgi:RNA polymerase primary sigma factor